MPPGEIVEINARVRAPGRSGTYKLGFEMVREQVGWFGPSAGKRVNPIELRAIRLSAWLATLFSIAALGFGLFLRLRPPGHRRFRLIIDHFPLLWSVVH